MSLFFLFLILLSSPHFSLQLRLHIEKQVVWNHEHGLEVVLVLDGRSALLWARRNDEYGINDDIV